MFLRETNDVLRHQAGDMKDDDDDSDYEDYNSYFFRFGRALISYDKNQMIKEANEKWSLEPCSEKKSPTKIRFSDDVNYVDPSDDEEIEENEFSDIEEDFVLFSQRLLDEIQSDLNKIPRKSETITEMDVNENNNKDDKGKSNQPKESNLCLKENETKEKNIKVDLNVQNVMTNGHRNDIINRSENTKRSHGILLNHSRTSIKNASVDDHLGKKKSLKVSKSEAGVLPLNQKSSLRDGKHIQDTVLNGKHNPVKDHKRNLIMKLQKEVYNKDHKHKYKKIQNKNNTLDKPEIEIQSNNLNTNNEEFNNASIKNCFLNANVKQENQKVKKKPKLSIEDLKNIPSSLMKIENFSLTKQFNVSNKLETAKKSLQVGIVLNNERKKHKLDNYKISDESTDINKKQTKNVDKLESNNITTTSMKVKNFSTKTSIMKKTKSQILPEKQKVSSKKTSLLLGKKLKNISSMESENVTNRLSTNKISSIEPKQSVDISVNINKNAPNLTTTEKQCTSNILSNSNGKFKQKDTSVPAVRRVKSYSLELQNVPDRCKINKSMIAAKKSKGKCPPMVKKTE